MPHVYRVDPAATTWLNKKNPPSLGVAATGLTRSGGWTNGRLEARVYVTPPADGVQEFDFVAEPPTGPAPAAILPIAGAGGLDPSPDWLRGVRVIAETNSVERVFGAAPGQDGLIAETYQPEPEAEIALASSGAEEIEFLEPLEEAIALFTAEGVQCDDITLMSVGGVPETKTEWETVCVLRAFGRCQAKTKVPRVYRRSTKLAAYARVCHPTLDAMLDDVRDCLKQAVAAGILAGVFTGNPAAVAPALKAYLIKCLKVKGADALDELELSVGTRKLAGRWIPI